MKLFLFFLCLSYSASVIAQERVFRLSVQKQTLTVSMDDNKEDKSINITTQSTYTKNDQLLITNTNWKLEKEWKRSFTLVDAEGQDISDIPETGKAGVFCISLENLSPLLQSCHTYKLYTVAFPRDPQKAMLVKIARQLVCTVKVK